MKTKPILNLVLILVGIVVMSAGPGYLGTELALALGFPFLMLGLYNISTGTKAPKNDIEPNSNED